MPTLSKKENFMRLLRGEIPEYVPQTGDGSAGFMMGPPELMGMVGGWEGEKADMFGVPYVTERNANYGALPAPGRFILEDITKWRDVIKKPDFIDDIDWELCSSNDLAKFDPETMILSGGASVGNGYFQLLVSFMGFDNGLIACVEEPEEVKDLLNFLLELNLELGKKYLYYYKPEVYGFGDDIAHERAPFVSMDIFLDIFEPVWRKTVAIYKEAGCLATHHNCGKLEELIPYIVDMGYNAWNPAEPQNDLVAIKEQFSGKLAICGGFDGNGFVSWPDTTEEQIRAYVRERMDLLAPGGGYAFGGGIMGAPDDEEVIKRRGWITDEFEKNRYSYYN